MPYLNQFGFTGLCLDLAPDLAPDGSLVGSSKNFRVIDGSITAAPGSVRWWGTALLGIPITIYSFKNELGNEYMFVFTTTDAYWWDFDNDTFKIITPKWGSSDTPTATVTTGGTGNRTVTASASTFTTGDIAAGDYIGFNTVGTAAEPSIDSIATWYKIATKDSATQLTLAVDGPTVGSATGYVIRKVYVGTVDNPWSCTTAWDGTSEKNWLIATNGVDLVQAFKGSFTTGRMEDLGGDPPKAKYVSTFAGSVFLGNIQVLTGSYGIDTKYCVMWSGTSDPETWDGTGGSGFQELYDTIGEIRFMVPFVNYLLVGKEDAMVLMSYSGNPDAPFNQNCVVKGIGAEYDPVCITPYGVIFIAKDDIYLFDGTQEPKSVAANKIKTAFFSDINREKKRRVHGTYDPISHCWEVWTPKQSSNDYPNQCWIFNTDTREWFYDVVADSKYVTCSGLHRSKNPMSWNDMGMAWSDATMGWDSPTLVRLDRYDRVYFGRSDGYIYQQTFDWKEDFSTLDTNRDPVPDSGTDIDMSVELKDIFGSDIDSFDRYQYVAVHYKGTVDSSDAITVEISVDGGVNWTSIGQTFNNNESAERLRTLLSFNSAGRVCRVRYSGRFMILYGNKVSFELQGYR